MSNAIAPTVPYLTLPIPASHFQSHREASLSQGRERGELNLIDGDGLLWHTHLKPHASGDFSIAVSQDFISPSATYVGVYDGHGGPASSPLPSSPQLLNPDPNPSQLTTFNLVGLGGENVIRKAFDNTEKEFMKMVKSSLRLRRSDLWLVQFRMTCCMWRILETSKAVLGRRVSDYRRGNAVVAGRLSTDHNVGVEEVRKEAEALHPDDAYIMLSNHGVCASRESFKYTLIIKNLYRLNCSYLLLFEAAKRREIRYDDIKKMEKGARGHFHDDITVI
ncbi:LOW QUALITY PROTEIN: hypothetical protein RJ641_032117, partial [Dillenia turbinata]